MKKIERWLWFYSIRDWFRPFRYMRLSYDQYLRVRLWWWFRFLLSAIMPAIFGYMLTLGAMSMATMGMQYGTGHVTGAEVIGWYAAKLCQVRGMCSAETVAGVVTAVLITSCGLGWLVWFLCPSWKLSPSDPSEAELEEFRHFIQREDLKDGFHEYSSVGNSDRPPLGDRGKPGQLDPVSFGDQWEIPEGEGDPEPTDPNQ